MRDLGVEVEVQVLVQSGPDAQHGSSGALQYELWYKLALAGDSLKIRRHSLHQAGILIKYSIYR